MSNGTPSPLAIPAPGTSVPSGSLVTPSGSAGPAGPVGSAGSAGPAGPAGPNAVSTDAGNVATLGSDSKIYVPGSTSAGPARSFNSIGNPNFEVDARSCGTPISLLWDKPYQDRWYTTRTAASTLDGTVRQMAGNVVLPGTNFIISQNFLRVTLTTAEPTLAVGDYLITAQQVIEGPLLRELIGSVHSVSVLARSTVANLKFGLYLNDKPNAPTRTLTKLCSLGAANTWSLIPLANLPVFDPGGTWVLTPGNAGYMITLSLACGSGYMAPANDTWLAGTYFGAVGQSNFANNPVNSTFDVAFIQHEPGAVCTTLIDKPFNQNLDECLRYYQKSYDYGTKPGTVAANGQLMWYTPNFAAANQWIARRFYKPMAVVPTLFPYSPATGALNNLRNDNTTADVAVSAFLGQGQNGFGGVTCSAAPAAGQNLRMHYTADTGW